MLAQKQARAALEPGPTESPNLMLASKAKWPIIVCLRRYKPGEFDSEQIRCFAATWTEHKVTCCNQHKILLLWTFKAETIQQQSFLPHYTTEHNFLPLLGLKLQIGFSPRYSFTSSSPTGSAIPFTEWLDPSSWSVRKLSESSCH